MRWLRDIAWGVVSGLVLLLLQAYARADLINATWRAIAVALVVAVGVSYLDRRRGGKPKPEIAQTKTSLDRSSEEQRVRDLKETLDKGPNYAYHFHQLRRWFPINQEDVVDDREIDEFNTDAWHLDHLVRVLSVAAPQLPPNIQSNCQHLAELIQQARHDLARLSEVAGQEKLRALTQDREATWDRARDQFGGQLTAWLELLQGQAASDLGPTYDELHRILEARIDS